MTTQLSKRLLRASNCTLVARLCLLFTSLSFIAHAACISGSYTGNGSSQNITTVGFQPDIVIIKDEIAPAAGTSAGMQIRTSTMSFTKHFGQTAAGSTSTSRITGFLSNGFSVGSDSTVNATGIKYNYLAIKTVSGESSVGTYSGDSVDNRTISGLGFQPDFVMTMDSNGTTSGWTTNLMPADTTFTWDLSPFANGIQALSAGGFQLGNDPKVNTTGNTYHYIAFKNVAGKFKTGSYVGTGANQSFTGMGFRPEALFVKRDSTTNGNLRFASTGASTTADVTLQPNSSTYAVNAILSLDNDGFSIGTAGNRINGITPPNTYHYIAFANVAAAAAPTVTTAAQSAVTATSATLGGNVTADGGASVTERGIVWGTSTGPTTANNKVQNGSGTGAFSGTVTGLPANTTIFVRAYAINSVNTSYGSEISFTTLAPSASINRSPSSVSEDGATNITYSVTLSPAVPVSTTINITTSGTATFGTDYTGAPTTLTIPANTTTGTITIDPTLDGTVEADETVILTVAPGTGYTVGAPSSATATILNDDVPAATLAVSPASVAEDGISNLVYTVTLNQASFSAISVAYNVGGTATNGTDYALIASPLVIPAGNTTGTITVNPTADATIEANETVILSLAAGAGYIVGVPNSATGTIDNDDLPADIPLTLSTGTLTINASGSAGAANLTLRFVTGAGGPFLEVVDTSRTLSAPAGGTQVNANTVRIPVASLTSIVLTGSILADVFTLDFSAGDICPPGGIAVNGGAPTTSPGDTLIIDGDFSSGGSYGTGAPGAGTLTLDTGNTVTFTGLEPVDMSAASFTDFTVTVDAGNVFSGNVITTVAAVDAGVNTNIDFGTSGLESAKLGTVTGTLTINGDNLDNDYFMLQGLGTAMTGHFAVDGRGGDADVIEVNNTTFTVAGLNKNLRLKADFIGLGRVNAVSPADNPGVIVCSGNITLEADGDSSLVVPIWGASGIWGTSAPAYFNALQTPYTSRGSIQILGEIKKTAGADATLLLKAKHSVLLLNTTAADGTSPAGSIVSTSGRLNTTLHADSDAAVAGNVMLQHRSVITTNGGSLTIGGGADPATAPATGIAGATNTAPGVALVSTTITTAGGNVSIRGRGAANASGIGVLQNVSAGSVNCLISTGAGNVTIQGDGGSNTTSTHGYFLLGNATAPALSSGITTTTGSVLITGSSGGGTNDGVRLSTLSSISTGSGNIQFTSGLVSFQNFMMNPASGQMASVSSASGNITIRYDKMNLNGGLGTESISTGSSNEVNLRVNTSGVSVDLGSTVDTTPSMNELSIAELNNITAGQVRITSANLINVTAVIAPSTYTTLALEAVVGTVFTATGGFSADVTSASVFEKITARGTVTVNAGATLAMASTGGYTWNGSDSFTMLDNDGTDTITGTFTGPTLTTFLGSTLTATQSYTGGSGNDFVITAPPSANADLAALTTTAGALSPVFSAATVSYSTPAVPNATSSVTVTATRAQANATLEVRVNSGSYGPLTSGSASGPLALNVGANTIDVRVTAQDTTTQKTYRLNITRSAPPGAPTITSVAPARAPLAGGTTVVITGTDFTGATGVTIGGTAATGVTVNSPTQITATVPAGTGGIFDITVTTGLGTGTGSGLFYYYTTSGGTPTMAASKVDLYTPNGAGKVLPGAPIQYRTLIANTGAGDATGVDFADAIPANTTLVPGSVNVSPLAEDNSYATIVNTQLAAGSPTVLSGPVVTSATKVTDNDREFLADTFTISAFDATSANGGSVVMVTSGPNMGSFTYVPAAGFVGVDSFTYTLRDDGTDSTASNADDLTGIGTVVITVNDANTGLAGTQKVWYIDNSYTGANGTENGTSARPFNALSDVSGASGPDVAGDVLYLTHAGTSYTGGITLQASQSLLGNGNALVLNGVTLRPAGTKPVITNAAGNGVTLATDNTLQGITLGNRSGAAIFGLNFGTLTVTGSVDINGTGQPLELSTGVLNATFESVSTSNAPVGVFLGGISGTLAMNGGSISGCTDSPFEVNTSSATVTYAGSISNTVSTENVVSMNANTGGTVTFSGAISDTGRGISLLNNTNTTINFSGGLSLSCGTNPFIAAFNATGGGMVNVTGATNTLATTAATALNVANTNIGASGLTFRSISANGAVNGIVLNNTGTSGGLTVTGTGNTTVGGNASGGTIQNTTGAGILLTNTQNVSLTNVTIQNTADSGIDGTQVTNFTFDNGTITNSGIVSQAEFVSNIDFNDDTPTLVTQVSGIVTITDSVLSNAYYGGVDIQNFGGAISNLTISNNSIVSTTTTATSKAPGIRVIAFGGADITRATINANTVTNFPSDAGIMVQGGNALEGGDSSNLGTPGSGTDIIAITNNTISGASATNRIGTQGILTTINGTGQGNFNITGNSVSHTVGNSISQNAFGDAIVTSTISNNIVISNNSSGSQGIAGGTSFTGGFLTNTPSLRVTISGNNVSQTDGNGILFVARDLSNGVLAAKIVNNTVAAPLAGVRPGIRVDAGNASGDNAAFLEISGNTSAGSGGSQGIGLRKQGSATATNRFAVRGMTATATPGIETFINAQNPAGGGTLLISATGGFSEWTGTGGQPAFLALLFAESLPETDFEHSTVEMLPVDRIVPVAEKAAKADLAAQIAPKAVSPAETLTQATLEKLAAEAIARWEASGLTPAQSAKLHSLRFELADLGALHLGQSRGDLIQISRKAGGNDWFIDQTPSDDSEFGVDPHSSSVIRHSAAGGVDLLTTLMHEMGHALGLEDRYDLRSRRSLMFGHLTRGERRLPAKGEAAAAVPFHDDTSRFLGATINIGTLPAGKSVTIVGTVLVNDPANTQLISSQGNITGTNFTALVTDDPAFAGTTNPTTTPVERPDAAVVSINRVAGNPRNTSHVLWQMVFDQPVSNLVAANFALANTGLTAPSITGITALTAQPATTWNIEASTGSGDGSIGLNLANDGGSLSHDITNLPFIGQVYTIDKTPPVFTSLTRQTPSGQNTNADTLVFRATFSEAVTGVNGADFTVTGTTGSITNVTGSGSGPYDITVSGGDLASLNGTVSLALAGAQNIADAAGNPLPGTAPATNQTFIVDNTAPTVTIASATGNPAANAVIPVTVTFSESVTGFDLTDITVAGGTKTNFAGAGATYTFDLTPSGPGVTVTADIAADAAQDAATNGNTAATQFTRTILDSVSVAATTATAAEGGATGLYTFTRGVSTGDLTVSFQLDASSTATAATDFNLTSSGTLTFNTGTGAGTIVIPNGQLTATVTLTALAETPNPAEAAETARLNVVAASGYVVGASPNATVTITENSFLVTTTSDSGTGSLRQAVSNANSIAGTDTITFSDGTGGTVNFTDASADTISLSGGQISLTSSLTIAGPGANLLILQNTAPASSTSRVIRVTGSSIAVRLSGLTITGGNSTSAGGGMTISANGSTVDVIGCAIVGNSTTISSGGIRQILGSLTVVNSTISGNTSTGTTTGGGIESSGTALTLINSTVSGNSVTGSSANNGGGISTEVTTTTIHNCTITNNSGVGGISGVRRGGGTVTVSNSIIAGNVGNTDIGGTFTSGGGNLIGNAGTATGFTNGLNNDQVGNGASPINPQLAALANNGGPTQTHALLAGSPALNAGLPANIPADTFDLDGDTNVAEPLPFDQRGTGFTRAIGTVDIGAFEAAPPEITVFDGSGIAGAQRTDNAGVHSFGVVAVGTSSVPQTFTIQNTGNGPMALGTVTVTGLQQGEFSVTQPVSTTLTPNATTTFTVTFSPTTTGWKNAIINIPSNDADENPFRIIVRGADAGSPDQMPLPGQTNTFPGNARGYWFTAPTDMTIVGVRVPTTASTGAQSIAVMQFNAVPPVFSASTNAFTTLYLTQNNPDSGVLSVNIPVTAGTIIGVLGTRGGLNSYAPGDLDTFILGMPVRLERLGMQFPLGTTAPRDIWREFGSSTSISRVDLYTLPGTPAVQEIAVEGNAANISNGDTTPDSADHTDFGSNPVNTGSVTRTFTIRNTSIHALNVTLGSISISGPNAGDFTVTSAPPSSVLSSTSATFQVTFDPSAPGLRTATLSIPNNDGDENPFTFALQGTGLPPVVSLATANAGDADAVEGGVNTGLYTFTRSDSVGPLTVGFQLHPSSTATAGTDFTLSGANSFSSTTGAGTVTFANGSTTATVTLTALVESPNGAEAAETARIDLTANPGVYDLGVTTTATVSIAPNSFLVINTNDSGTGSLRQAILNANAIPGDDTITFGSPVFTDGTVPDVITLTSGSLLISTNMTIQGSGADVLSVSGGNASRIIENTSSGSTIRDIGLTGGHAIGTGNGGAGGAIFNFSGSTLSLVRCQVAGNTADTFGGGINNFGTLTIVSSTISNNTADSTGSGGGGINNFGPLTLINSTISGNAAPNASAAGGGGGGINNFSTLTVINSTITGNRTSVAAGGGGLDARGTETLSNTIVAGNFEGAGTTPSDIENGTINTANNNVISDAGTAGGITHDADGNPAAGNNNVVGNAGAGTLDINTVLNTTLDSNGGPTLTHALINGSPAINNGLAANLPADTFDLDGDLNVAEALPVDQRGGTNVRTRGPAPDAGAVEAFAFEPTITASTTDEDTQSTSGLVVSANTADGGLTTHYQVTSINNGTLYQNDGTTPIAANDYITLAQGAAGLKFTPGLNLNDTTTASFGFTVQAAVGNTTPDLRGATVSTTISVTPVNDAPTVVAPGIPDQTAVVGLPAVVVPLGAHFADVDLDTLTFSVTGNTDPTKANAVLTGGTNVTLTALAFGETDVTITADDSGGGTVTDTFRVFARTQNPTATMPTAPGGGWTANPQTGLFDIVVPVRNTTAGALNGFRLTVNFSAYNAVNPSPQLVLYNRTNTVTPNVPSPAYIDFPYPVAVGAIVQVKLSFHTPFRARFPNPFVPGLDVTALQVSETGGPLPAGMTFVPAIIRVTNVGEIILEWPSVVGKWYRIYYTDNMTTWFPSSTPIQASITQMRWSDTGAPFTQTPPGASRFYQITEIPAPAAGPPP